MSISLQTNQENQVLLLSDFKTDSYVYAFTLFVKSGSFSATVPMSHYETNWLSSFTNKLAELETRQATEAVLEDEQYNKIAFRLDHLGHLEVSGQLKEYTDTAQKLDFAFVTDQTCLHPFVAALRKLRVD